MTLQIIGTGEQHKVFYLLTLMLPKHAMSGLLASVRDLPSLNGILFNCNYLDSAKTTWAEYQKRTVTELWLSAAQPSKALKKGLKKIRIGQYQKKKGASTIQLINRSIQPTVGECWITLKLAVLQSACNSKAGDPENRPL